MHKKNNLPHPPSNSVHSYSHRIIALLFIIFITFAAFGLSACNNGTYVKLQSQDKAKQELVSLLKDYHKVYLESKDLILTAGSPSIAFVFKGDTVLTSDNILSITAKDNALVIELDDIGKRVMAEISLNIGSSVEIVLIKDEEHVVILSVMIEGYIYSNALLITGALDDSAKLLSDTFKAKNAEDKLKQTAKNYNAKRQLLRPYIHYLPMSVPRPPQMLDVSNYLFIAEQLGFNVS